MRHVKLVALLAVILAVSLGPSILFRFYPNETLGYLLNPLWGMVKSQTGLSGQLAAAISLVGTFVVTVVAASALSLILAGELLRSARGS